MALHVTWQSERIMQTALHGTWQSGRIMQTEKEFLQSYDTSEYPSISIAVDVVMVTTAKSTLQVLLIRRNQHPFMGKWSLPGTFVGVGENAEEAAERAILRKTGSQRADLEQLYTFSDIDRDPRMRIISVSYIAMMPEISFQEGMEDGKAVLFDIQREKDGTIRCLGHFEGKEIVLAAEDFAFDHYRILKTAIERMAGKVDYIDIAFRFLQDPDRFTLHELNEIFNAIKGYTLDASNFRRSIKNRYIVTGKIENNRDDRKVDKVRYAGRSAATYRYTGIPRQQSLEHPVTVPNRY